MQVINKNIFHSYTFFSAMHYTRIQGCHINDSQHFSVRWKITHCKSGAICWEKFAHEIKVCLCCLSADYPNSQRKFWQDFFLENNMLRLENAKKNQKNQECSSHFWQLHHNRAVVRYRTRLPSKPSHFAQCLKAYFKVRNPKFGPFWP